MTDAESKIGFHRGTGTNEDGIVSRAIRPLVMTEPYVFSTFGFLARLGTHDDGHGRFRIVGSEGTSDYVVVARAVKEGFAAQCNIGAPLRTITG